MSKTSIAGVNFILDLEDSLRIEYAGHAAVFYGDEIQEILDFLSQKDEAAAGDRLAAIEARLDRLEGGTPFQLRTPAQAPAVGETDAPAEEVIGYAINSGMKVKFNYRGMLDETAIERVVQAVNINTTEEYNEFFEGTYEDGDYRRFKLDGIEGPVLLDA